MDIKYNPTATQKESVNPTPTSVTADIPAAQSNKVVRLPQNFENHSTIEFPKMVKMDINAAINPATQVMFFPNKSRK